MLTVPWHWRHIRHESRRDKRPIGHHVYPQCTSLRNNHIRDKAPSIQMQETVTIYDVTVSYRDVIVCVVSGEEIKMDLQLRV